MARKDVAQLIKEATEAVKDVPDDLRAVAFQKAFDALVGEPIGGPSAVDSKPDKGRRTRGGGGKRKASRTDEASNRSKLDQLDRTSHPEISQDASSLVNALRVLKAAYDDLDIDGLSAPEVTHVLTNKFRCTVSRRAVSNALNDAGQFVNRHTEGKSVIFRIMSAGEQHLAELESGTAADATIKPKKKSKRARKPRATSNTETDSTAARKKTTKKKASASRRSGSRPGPKAAVQALIDAGFFSMPRTSGDIIKHLKHTLGHAYSNDEMAPTVLRLLREGALTRDKNSDNQYEYTNA